MAKQDYSIDVGMWAVQPGSGANPDAILDTLVPYFEKIWNSYSCFTKRACNILMTYGLMITCLLLLSSLETWGQWELKLRGGKWDRSINLVHFITPEQGWAVGFGTAFWTEDGGETWNRRDLNIWPTASFPNALDGWQPPTQGQVSIRGPYPPLGAQIPFERSFDGGLSWIDTVSVVTEVIELNPPSRKVYGFSANARDAIFYFWDSQTGFTAGSTYGGKGPDGLRAFYIGKTSDGGKSWTLYLHWGNWAEWGLAIDIEFFDAQNGWVLVAYPYILFRTHDGGRTWQHQMFSQQMYPLSIELSASKEGWMCLIDKRNSKRGEIWHSIDGGQTWEVKAEIFGGISYDIVFINPHEGWMALFGLARAPNLGLDDVFSGVLHTKDGGRTWEVELDVTSNVKIDIKNSVGALTYDTLTQTLWARGGFETLYKQIIPVAGVSPRGKLPLPWGQLK